MKLDQVIYGRGGDGYRILACSLPECGLTDFVVDLCQAVGTPALVRAEDDVPLLIQQTVGDQVVMVCGRTGPRDSLGRGTLVFHAYAGDLAEARIERISADVLWQNGYFEDGRHESATQPVEVRGTQLRRADRTASARWQLPAVVCCRRADNLKLLDTCGVELVGTSWATFSWRQLENFDWYGLDATLGARSVAAQFNVYDAQGVLVRAAQSSTLTAKVDQGQADPGKSPQPGGRMGLVKVGAVCMLLGLVGGFLLRANCSAPPVPVTSPAVDPAPAAAPVLATTTAPALTEEQRRQLRMQIEQEVRRELEPRIRAEQAEIASRRQSSAETASRPTFDASCRIREVSELKTIPYYQLVMGSADGLDANQRKDRALFRKIAAYIEFVNRNFPDAGEKEVK